MDTDHKTISKDSLAICRQPVSGDIPITGDAPNDNAKPNNMGRLDFTDFQFDDTFSVIIQCPAGFLSKNRVVMGRYTVANFTADTCRACRMLNQCPTIFSYDNVVVIKFKRKRLAAYKREVLSKRP